MLEKFVDCRLRQPPVELNARATTLDRAITQGAGHPCYHVNPEKKTCTCLDHQEAGHFCKHLFAVKFVIQREFEFDAETGTTTETETVLMQTVKKTTYSKIGRHTTRPRRMKKPHSKCCYTISAKTFPMSHRTRTAASANGRCHLCRVFKVYTAIGPTVYDRHGTPRLATSVECTSIRSSMFWTTGNHGDSNRLVANSRTAEIVGIDLCH